MIPVTKSYLPDLARFDRMVERVWRNGWITNRGELCNELEKKIKDRLQSTSLIMMNNGTIPLQIAMKLLGNRGEIITTPFSYVATVSSIIWEGCTPVFVDIHPEELTINPDLIEAAITERTTCILATHVFGNICHVERIAEIANRYNLKVVYDAAHCFDVNYKGQSIFNFGDIATGSFHATKIFHTGEGGALFSKDEKLIERAFRMHNFGHTSSDSFEEVGINGKISELSAAMGLCVLEDMDFILKSRKEVVKYYNNNLSFRSFRTIELRDELEWNAAYFPIWFTEQGIMLKVINALEEHSIYPRRYFSPSLNKLPYVNGQKCPISESISQKIICLPLYVGLKTDELKLICEVINKNS
jgi:dTDP-4-amino-4,6-dideoxygalactose transaminase